MKKIVCAFLLGFATTSSFATNLCNQMTNAWYGLLSNNLVAGYFTLSDPDATNSSLNYYCTNNNPYNCEFGNNAIMSPCMLSIDGKTATAILTSTINSQNATATLMIKAAHPNHMIVSLSAPTHSGGWTTATGTFTPYSVPPVKH